MLCLHLSAFVVILQTTLGQSSGVFDANVSSTESTISVAWDIVNTANDSMYMLRHHRANGIFMTDLYVHSPFNQSHIEHTITKLYPGVLYSVYIFRNTNESTGKIFMQNIHTVPLPPVDVRVIDVGSTWMEISWDPGHNSTQSSHVLKYTDLENSGSRTEDGTKETHHNLTGLQPGHRYTISIQAVVANKQSNESEVISSNTAPASPTDVFVTALNTTHLSVTWKPGTDSLQDSYKVAYSLPEKLEDDTPCGPQSPCVFAPAGLPGDLYNIYVYALRQNATSSPTTVQHNTKPRSVSNLQGSAGVRSITVTWVKPDHSQVEFYKVHLVNTLTTAQQDFNVSLATGNQEKYTFSEGKLQGGVSYNVMVYSATRTEDSVGQPQLVVTIPESPRHLEGVALNTTAIHITWDLPTESNFDQILVKVTKPNQDVVNITLGKTETSKTIVNLISGNMYEIAVSVFTNVVHSTPVIKQYRTKPDPPSFVLVEPMDRSVSVNLAKTGDGETGYFVVYLDAPNPEKRNITLQEGTTTFQNLQEGMPYNVSAYSVSGYEESETVTHPFYTKPRPPSSVNVTAFNSTVIEVVWSVPDRGQYDTFTLILVQSEGTSQQVTTTTTATFYTFPSVEAGQSYNITIFTNLGSEKSVSVLRQVTTTPLSITQLWVSSRSAKKVVVNWDAPTGTLYDYFVYEFSGSTSMNQLPRDQFQLVLENLEPAKEYKITIYAASISVNEDLKSLPTVFTFVTYPDTVATLQKIEANTTAIHVNWTAPSSGPSFDYYFLTIVPPDGPEPNMTRGNGDTTIWFVGLRSGQMYNITITTVKDNRHGPSSFGVPTYVLAVTEPEPVTSYNVTSVNNESIAVTWIASTQTIQDFFIIEYTLNGQLRKKEVQFDGNIVLYKTQLTGLLSGHTYNVSTKSVRSIPPYDIGFSSVVSKAATTYPKAVDSLRAQVADTTVNLKWEPAGDSQQDTFRIDYRSVLRDPTSELQTETSLTPEHNFPDLFNGEKYEFSVYAISKGMISTVSTATAVIAPLAPTNVSVIPSETTTSTITLHWVYEQALTYVQKWKVGAHNDTFTIPATEINSSTDTEISHTFNGLRPGTKYNFDVIAISELKQSPIVIINSTVRPVLSISWSESEQQTSNTSIVFKYSLPNTDEMFDKVRFTVNDSSSDVIYRPKQSVNVIAFNNLFAGTLYRVSASSVIRSLYSDPSFLYIRTRPNPVPLDYTAKPNEIFINFKSLVGNADKFVVLCDRNGESCWNHEYQSNTHQVKISGLSPFTQYNITVDTVAGDKTTTETFTVSTTQAAPSEVRNVRAVERNIHSVMVTWTRPEYLNGVLQKYIVSYTGYDPTIDGPRHSESHNVQNSETSLELSNLKAGFFYNISVKAETVAIGESGFATVRLQTSNPTFKDSFTAETAKPRQTTTGEETVGETFVKVTFPNAFSDGNGRIVQYTVIVTTDLADKEFQKPVLPSWSEAQTTQAIKAYQTIKNCSDFFAADSSCGVPTSRKKRAEEIVNYKVFTVGAETNCAEREYCNGPLKPGTEYHFKLRAYTTGGYTDTVFSQKIKTATVPSNAGGIVGGVIAALVAVGVIAGVLIFLRRRRPKKTRKHTGDWVSEPAPMNKFSRPVKLAEFKEHVRRMAADSDFKYAEEYEDLKEVGRDQHTLAAEFPPNRPKNRFTNILPYDHSRVKLLPTDDEEGSDYINANYVPGYTSKREYIATQGPLPSTRDDFWRMVWEQNTRTIVMLTKCMEKGREKSDHYWPADSEPKFYGDLQVAILNETHLPDWTLSEFRVQLGEQTRHVRHFHYKSWPDFGVPKDPTSLIRFVRMVRERMFREGGPIVTHCSAGVGRSGTFIVLDHLLQLIKDQDVVDIYQIVYKLRKERVCMVQTEQQYKFIHECLLCVLEGREDEAMYANVGHVNVAYDDDEGINIDIP